MIAPDPISLSAQYHSSAGQVSAHVDYMGTLRVSGSAQIKQNNGKVEVYEYMNGKDTNSVLSIPTFSFDASKIRAIFVEGGNEDAHVDVEVGEAGRANTIKHVVVNGGDGNDRLTVGSRSEVSGVVFQVDGRGGKNELEQTAMPTVLSHDNFYQLTNGKTVMDGEKGSNFSIKNPDSVFAYNGRQLTGLGRIEIDDNDSGLKDIYALSGAYSNVHINSDGNNVVMGLDATNGGVKAAINSNHRDQEAVKDASITFDKTWQESIRDLFNKFF